jgi:hypothetical protein
MSIPDFHHKLCAYLDSKTAPVDIIPKEQVVCLRQLAANFKYLHKVILGIWCQGNDRYKGKAIISHVLSMYITDDYTNTTINCQKTNM